MLHRLQQKLTPYIRVLLERPVICLLIKNFSAFYGILMCNYVFTKFTFYWTPYLNFFKVKYRSVICISTEVLTVVNMKNVIFWDISSWFLTGISIGVSCREYGGSKLLQNVTFQYTVFMLPLHIRQGFHFLCTPHFSDRNCICPRKSHSPPFSFSLSWSSYFIWWQYK